MPGTPGSDASCWRLHTISINLAAFDGLTLENKNRLEQCRRTGAAVSLLPVGCRVSVEASDPLTTPAPTTQGDGGEGEGRVRGCCLSSSKVNGCHGPANGDGEPTVNLTLPVRVLCGVGGSGWRGGGGVWMGSLSQTEALCCSSQSVVLPLFLSPPLSQSFPRCHLYVI